MTYYYLPRTLHAANTFTFCSQQIALADTLPNFPYYYFSVACFRCIKKKIHQPLFSLLSSESKIPKIYCVFNIHTSQEVPTFGWMLDIRPYFTKNDVLCQCF